MEEAKRKEIEAKLIQLFAQTEQTGTEKSPTRKTPPGARIIRRRKGKSDLQVA
jgi:hypothetical protein